MNGLTPIRRWLAMFGLLLLSVSESGAITIVNLNGAAHHRFDGGFPGAPVESTNGSFVGAGYDWSGVGWAATNSTKFFTMINDTQFVHARHSSFSNGSIVHFNSPTNGLVSYTVGSAMDISNPLTGVIGDLRITSLATPLDPLDEIATYPILALGPAGGGLPVGLSSYIGLSLLATGHNSVGNNQRVGTNELDSFAFLDLYNGGVGGMDGTLDTIGFITDQDPGVTGQTQAVSGDSGSPTFVPWDDGQLGLVGFHTSVGTTTEGLPATFDTFVPAYLDRLTAAGVDFEVIPEPSRAMLLLVGVGSVIMRRWRR
ncbi:MAG: PEP-CTERM sorting domain-containing protein [Verrucomicrobiota bacterium]